LRRRRQGLARRVRRRPEPNTEDRNGHGSCLSRNFTRKIAARLPRLPATGRAQNNPRLFRFYRELRLQSDGSASDARRAGVCKLMRLVPRYSAHTRPRGCEAAPAIAAMGAWAGIAIAGGERPLRGAAPDTCHLRRRHAPNGFRLSDFNRCAGVASLRDRVTGAETEKID